MTFFTKLKKLKKLNNRRFSPSFTLIELIVVIVLIGILISTISFNLSPDKLNLAADDIIKNIRFTQSLALKDDKYQPFPIDDSVTELNRSKYWFKQWWQINFTKNDDNDHYWYEIFSDLPDSGSKNFDKTGYFPTAKQEISIARDPSNNKLLIGRCNSSSTDHNYPDCDEISKNLDLTKFYGIKKIEYNGKSVSSTNKIKLVFDNFGNIFLDEGNAGDNNDINPLDEDKREVLTKNLKIKLYSNSGRCLQINVTPNGEIFKSKCE
jgi:prepilin-type N-terminal cleavage/methylation domain-containing protein